jgi:hypothetical protein
MRLIHGVTTVNETRLQSGWKLNGKREDMLTCCQNAMLKGSCDKYSVKYFDLLFFNVSVFTSLL